MTNSNEVSQLIESLIRMVGRANQHVDSLQRRVSQLEWQLREQQFESSRKAAARNP